MTLHYSFLIKNNRYGFCFVTREIDYRTLRIINCGLYLLTGPRFGNSKKVFEWRGRQWQ